MGEMTTVSLAVLGGDRRQKAMIKALAERGFFVKTWDIPIQSERLIQTCTDWQDAIEDVSAVILPLPYSFDGVRVNTAKELRMDALLVQMRSRCLLGGKLDDSAKDLAVRNGVRCIDYYESEILQLKNALPSAEGAISIAMQHLPVTLDGCETAVIGYGRIGSLLAHKLNALGARVTVFARREEALVRAQLARCNTIQITSGEGVSHLTELSPSIRVVFNTVPERLLKRRTLEALSRDCLLIDLASAPGGIDFIAAEELGFQAVWATALPGKYAPESAGYYLAQTIEHVLKGECLI